MPFISDQQLAIVSDRVANLKEKLAKATHSSKAKEKAGEGLMIAEALGAAMVMGLARAKLEKADGSLNIPGTAIPVEAVVSAAAIGCALFDALGPKYDDHLLAIGLGIGGHYMGQFGYKMGKGVGARQALVGATNPHLIGAASGDIDAAMLSALAATP